ncbi:MAG: efflux RND transporter periplasmic adaptor subunit [Deltaproteobacteria bacterium]|nr:efflux RND transporter periplasmic adaptor subunit [Deltaproteobacteria bacterium]
MKSAKILGLVVLIAATFVFGYYWRGRSDMSAGNSVSSQPSTENTAASDSMAGHDMSDGAVSVSPEKQQLVGIRTAVAEVRPLVKKIRTVGIVTYDETKVAQVFTKVEGWIEKLFVNYTGKLVEKGQPLFTLYSPDLVATQDEYLLALQAKESLASSSLQEIRAGSASLLEATRRRLSLWDISDEQIKELQRSRQLTRTLTFYAPSSGFVIKKDAVQGMKVMPDKELYTITDLSAVWVNADIYEFDLANVRLGQRATIALSYFPGQTFSGKVTWISPVLEEKTRTTKVRLEFANRDFKLKPEMYANVEIEVDGGKKLAIPDEAVLDSGIRKIVFIDKGDGRYAPAEVKLGSKFDGYYEVLSGLSPGERIIASASFLLDSESRLKEAMGAMAGMPGMDMGETQKKAPAAATATEKKAGDLTLALETQPAKPKLGENVIRLKIRDAKGAAVQDATVNITSTMTMPGMAPGKAVAKHVKDGVYEATVNLAMAGAWEIGVSIQRPGQKEIRERFTLRVG